MDIVIVLILTLLINQLFFKFFRRRHRFFNIRLMNGLYFYHLIFFLAYFIYAMYRPSDSKHYYFLSVTQSDYWLDFFETSTPFITFLAIPFVKSGLSYAGTMLLFAWLGYLGFVFAYLFFRENVPNKIKVFGVDFLTLLLFLPNMHFWTASLGKGAVIFLGLMMVAYAIKKPFRRWIILVLGAFLVYMVRPHVMLFMVVGITFGYLRGREKINPVIKFLVIILMIAFLFFASDTILKMVNLENSENLTQDFMNYSELQAERLSESSGSGVNMNNYPLPFKFFTFWFRPLFIDAPNFLGLITSFENLLYLLIFLKIFNWRFIRFFRKAPYMVKMSGVTFLLATFALTFLMSNLGIIMRQKSQVMYFAFFVIYYFLAEQEAYKNYKRMQIIKKPKHEY